MLTILASYDWMMQESSGIASDYITTTIQFLENTFRAFTHLPVSSLLRNEIEKQQSLKDKRFYS